ncbi:ABC transporter permease subunit [Aquisalimonas sp. 2447]|uniref:ABC transporter permease subunit n=1 Tax=Aquisalimonas sp. 2447 TaxID=2740807 RepID=UPI0014325D50|nr:ABC transporter permease subunit [Aquisalimonas sp. 2447]QIT56837.1 ABC transporter permease subunit [Aquisalimonas sp. 2447]
MMTFSLAARELRMLFASPLPWIVLAVSQAVSAWWFLSLVEQFQAHYQPMLVRTNSPMGVTDLVLMPFFGSVVVLGMLLLAAALLAMRLLAEERRSGGLRLLYSSPISVTEMVLGKYLAALAFLLVLVATWLLMPLALMLGTELDLGRLAAAGLALLLLAATMASVALFASSITIQPPVAVVLTAGIMLALLGINAVVDGDDPLTGYLALLPHYETLVQGRVVSTDIVYFLVLVTGFLGFTIKRLDGLRLQAG